MTLEEARNIVERDEHGALDKSDPAVARAVGDAHRRIQRALISGRLEQGGERSGPLGTLVALGLLLAFGAIGLIVPLLLAVAER